MESSNLGPRNILANIASVTYASALVACGLITPARALVITGTFDSSITSNINAAAIENEINSAIAIYDSLFTDPLSVSILFRYSTTTPNGNAIGAGELAQSNFTVFSRPYGTYINALKNDATTSNDAEALAHLPTSPLAPVMAVTSANGRSVGLLTPGLMNATGQVGTGGTFDGIVTLSARAPFQFDRTGGIAPNRFDAQQSIEHEIDEILGLGSFLPRSTDPNGNPAVKPEDLFRYSAPGVNSFTVDPTATAYFSIDGGVTNIIGFNQGPNGDYGDWFSPPCVVPFVQYAFSCRGTQSDVSADSPEGIALDVIGYNMVVPEPGSLALIGLGFLSFALKIGKRKVPPFPG